MPRFVVLTHDRPFPHWDFLLEDGESCRTWRLLEEPGPGRAVAAEAIAEHRLHYLTYEGPVSGGRGTVGRWDVGVFEWVRDDDDVVAVTLDGTRLSGTCALTRAIGGWRAVFEE